MVTWSSNSILVKNICKFNANFTQLAKILKIMLHRLIYSFESLLWHKRKEQAVKALLLNILTLNYECRESLLDYN